MKNLKVFLGVVCCMSMAYFPNLQAQDKKSILLQGFWWDFKNNNYPQGWANYLVDLTPRLRQIGVDAVWVPVNQKNANPQSVGYSPFDHYDLGDKFQKSNLKTPFGDKDEYLRMVAVMHQNGINVIQDIVLNHMDGAGSANSAGGIDSVGLQFYNTNRPLSNYPDITNDPTAGYKNFRYVSYKSPATSETRSNYLARSGRWPKNWQNFNPGPGDNRYTGDDLTRLSFGPDIAFYQNSFGLSSISSFNPPQTENYMRSKGREWMVWLKKQTGIDGYRLDAIKHFPNYISEDYIYNMQFEAGFASGTDQLFTVGEWVGGKTELDAWVDAVQGRAGTFDFGLRGFPGGSGLYGMVYGLGNYDLSNLPGTQQNRRYRTVPFINNHDTFRPTQPAGGSQGLQANGNYPVDGSGNPVRWNSNSELSPNIDPREPRITAAYAIMMSMDGHPSVFFEDLFDVGTTGKRYTHFPNNPVDLPVRQSIANLIRCHRKFDFKAGDYRVRSAESTVFFDGSSAQDLIVFERSAKAIIAVTDNFTTNQAAWVDCDFAVGTVLKDYTGNFANVTVVTREGGVPGGRVRVQAPSCNGTANNTIRKGVAVYAPANLETFFNQPFPEANRFTTQEWELADDLGDSNPKSLGQGGALPANSKAPRTAGKIYAEAGKPVTARLFPSFDTRNLTLIIADVCGKGIDSVSGAGVLTKVFTPQATGWLTLKARNTLDTNREQRVWINVSYTAPDSLDALATRSRLIPFVDLGPDKFGCNPGSVLLNGFFEAGLTYVWRDSLGNQVGANNLYQATTAGKYSVTVTNPVTGCAATDEIRILGFVDNPVPNVVWSGDTLKVTTINAGDRFQWRINNVLSATDTNSYLLVPANATNIRLTITNVFGCTTTTTNLLTSVRESLLEEDAVVLFPNPARDQVTIQYGGALGTLMVEVIDLQGRKLRTLEMKGGLPTIENLQVGQLPKGLYLFHLQANGRSRTEKVLIQ